MTISPPSSLQSCLIVVAAGIEAEAVLGRVPAGYWRSEDGSPGFEVVMSGIGKANAAGAAARFADPSKHGAILSVGVAGALESGIELGQVIFASQSVFADEGLESPDGFVDCAAMGFPLGEFAGNAVPVSSVVLNWLNDSVAGTLPIRCGPIATVSTCSGTDEGVHRIRTRTAGIAEAMEGAAVGLAAHRLGIPFGEVRVISNTTGDRERQVWDTKLALSRLKTVMGLIAQGLRG